LSSESALERADSIRVIYSKGLGLGLGRLGLELGLAAVLSVSDSLHASEMLHGTVIQTLPTDAKLAVASEAICKWGHNAGAKRRPKFF